MTSQLTVVVCFRWRPWWLRWQPWIGKHAHSTFTRDLGPDENVSELLEAVRSIAPDQATVIHYEVTE